MRKPNKKFQKFNNNNEHKDAFAGKGKTGLVESSVDKMKMEQSCFSSACSGSPKVSVVSSRLASAFKDSLTKKTLFDTELRLAKKDLMALLSSGKQSMREDKPALETLDPIKETLEFNEEDEEDHEFEEEVMMATLKENFGFSTFRVGQLETIKHVFAGENTMAVLPPGQGKSLIYQFLAGILDGVTVVVTPFVSLAFDQISNMPANLPAAALTSFTSYHDRKRILSEAQVGSLKVLLCTPEKLLSENLEAFAESAKISLLVYDEASSLCKFSRNFRFAYLALKIAAEKVLKPRSTLLLGSAMTVDEEKYLLQEYNIVKLVKQPAGFPSKVKLSISKEDDKHQALFRFLRRTGIHSTGSTIVFCNSKYSIDKVNSFLRSNGLNSAGYHSGKGEQERDRIQNNFRTNKTSILISTVSFAVGMNKTDLTHLIIFDLPPNVEYFLQQVGRLGRGSIEGRLHVILGDRDFISNRKKIMADMISKESIKSLLQSIFYETSISTEKRSFAEFSSGGRPVRTKQNFSLKWDDEEKRTGVKRVTQIILIHELASMGCLTINAVAPISVTLRFYKTQPEELAKIDSLIGKLLPLCRRHANGTYRFDVAKGAQVAEICPNKLMYSLFNLQMAGELSYDASGEGCFMSFDNGPFDTEKLTDTLFEMLNRQTAIQVKKLNALYLLLRKFASKKFEQFFDGKEIITLKRHKSFEAYQSAFRDSFESYFSFGDEECDSKMLVADNIDYKTVLPLHWVDTARERSSLTVEP